MTRRILDALASCESLSIVSEGDGEVTLEMSEKAGAISLSVDEDICGYSVELDIGDNDSDCDDILEVIVVKLDEDLRKRPTMDLIEAVDRLVAFCKECTGSGGNIDAEATTDNDHEYMYQSDGECADIHHVERGFIEERDLRERLQRKDKELRAVKTTSVVVGSKRRLVEYSSASSSSKSKNNLYSPNASFSILVNDLLRLRKNAAQLCYDCEVVDDNIYKWRIKMHGFRPDCDLYMDLISLDDTYNYSYVEIEVDFAMDLHPVYPPVVSIVRPRFEGFMLGRIANLPVLQLSNWNQIWGLEFLLGSIRDVLERDGRVYLDSPLNDLKENPTGAYSALERQLLRLGLVTETKPRVLILNESKEVSDGKALKFITA